MRRPGLFVRVAGTAPMAMLLCFVYGLFIFGWFQGRVAWWLAVVAAVGALRTFAASGELGRYKAWEAEWNAMGGAATPAKPTAARPANKSGREWLFIIAAALLFLILPQYFDANAVDEKSGLVLLAWLGVCGYLTFAFFRGIYRRRQKRVAAKATVEATRPVKDEAVAWLLPPAAVSPSRAEAQSNLPEYCLRLIEGGTREVAAATPSTNSNVYTMRPKGAPTVH